MTARQMIEAGFTYYNSCGVEFSGLPEPVPGPDLNQIERATYENKTMYEAYEASDPVFDTSNLEQFASHLPCPEIDEAMIHRFLQFGEKDRWGRRKAPKPEIPIWVGEMLQAVVDEHVSGSANAVHHSTDCDSVASRSDRVHVVGLDLSGPGGGQWTMKLQGQTVVACEPGISKDDSVLRVPAEDFINLLSGCGKTIARLRGHETSTTGREKAKPLDLVTQIFRSQSTHGNLRRADSIATGSGSR